MEQKQAKQICWAQKICGDTITKNIPTLKYDFFFKNTGYSDARNHGKKYAGAPLTTKNSHAKIISTGTGDNG